MRDSPVASPKYIKKVSRLSERDEESLGSPCSRQEARFTFEDVDDGYSECDLDTDGDFSSKVKSRKQSS